MSVSIEANNKQPIKQTAVTRESIFAILGLSCLFSTLLIYSATITPFQRFEGLSWFIGIFAETSLAAAAVFALIFLFFSLRGKNTPFPTLIAVGGAGYLCGVVAFLSLTFIEVEFSILVNLAAVVAAFGDVALCLIWGRICTRFNLKQGLMIVSCACLVTALIYLLISHTPVEITLGIFLLCAIITVVLPATFKVSEAEYRESSALPHARKAFAILRSLADVVVAPFFGLLFFAFIMGILRSDFTESFDLFVVSLFIVAVILAAYSISHSKRFSIRGMQQTFIPLLAIVLLTTISITSTLGQGSFIAMLLIFLVYNFAVIMTISTLCAIANAREFPSDLIFSAAIALFALISEAGLVFSEILPATGIDVAMIVITTIYAFAMVLLGYLRRYQERTWDDRSTTQKTESSAERCMKLSEEYKLTSRESEILVYLSQGHTGAYISEALFISPNTARTHIHNIYRKMDVTSREDILRLTRVDEGS